MIFINGIMASQEDVEFLCKKILDEDLQFTATKDNFGNQYVETLD